MFLEQPFCLATGVAFNLLSDVIPGLALKRKPGVSYNDFQKKNKSREIKIKKSWPDFSSSQFLFFCLLT